MDRKRKIHFQIQKQRKKNHLDQEVDAFLDFTLKGEEQLKYYPKEIFPSIDHVVIRHFPQSEFVMRQQFKNQILKFITTDFLIPNHFEKYVHSKNNKFQFPYDLKCNEFIGNLYFVDFMNSFPIIQKKISIKDSNLSSHSVNKNYTFREKLNYLKNEPYLVSLAYIVKNSFHNDNKPFTPNDWIFIFSQCDIKEKNHITYLSLPILNNLNILIVKVPCKGIKLPCNVEFKKNEVDDYLLLLTVAYFNKFRKLKESSISKLYKYGLEAIFPESVHKFHNFLNEQKIYIFSEDNYDWTDKNLFYDIDTKNNWNVKFSIGKKFKK